MAGRTGVRRDPWFSLGEATLELAWTPGVRSLDHGVLGHASTNGVLGQLEFRLPHRRRRDLRVALGTRHYPKAWACA